MDHNLNATFCLDCKDEYTNTFHYYEETMSSYELNNKSNANKTCRELFVDNNQLNIVEMLFSNAKQFWDHGFCSGKIIYSFTSFKQIMV